MFIGGAWTASCDEEEIAGVAPADGKEYDSISRGKAADVDQAVKAAVRSLDGAWGRMTATERGRIMMRISQKVLDNADELTRIEAKDTGKPNSVARNDVLVL